jgi:Secretion system C-terminal sorting domain
MLKPLRLCSKTIRTACFWAACLSFLLFLPGTVSMAQAQFVVDGRASASEIGPGKYQLVSSYSGTHSEPDRGLKSLYVARTATTLNIMMVASPELTTDYSSLVLYLNAPGRTGAPAGVRLAGGSETVSPLLHRPVLDMEADYGLRLTTLPNSNPTTYFSVVDYTVAPTNGRNPDTDLGTTFNNGQLLTVSSGTMTGAKLAFVSTPSLAANSNTGWELEIPLTSLSAQVGSALDLFGAFTSSAGVFTTDIFPPVASRTTAFGTDPDFSTIAGTQAIRSTALTLDGRLDANEIGTGTAGLYQLVGEYAAPRPAGFGDYGLTKLYMASTATKMYFFAVGTVENNGNSFQLYLNVPGLTGVPRGTALPGTGTSSNTSFRNMRARLDMETDLALALEGTGSTYSVSVIRYAGGVSEGRATAAQPINGSPITYNTSGNATQFNGVTVAYRDSPTGQLSSNPGNYGWEIELDRTTLGVPATLANATLQAFLLQNSPDGDFLSSDIIPAVPGNGITNLGVSTGVDFTQLPGRQALTYAFSCPVAASVAYGAGSYCQSAPNPAPTITGPTGGAFSAPAGLSLNATTGAINLSTSTPGTYTVTYNADVVNCPTSATTQVTITRAPVASFAYGASAYCVNNGTAVTPVLGTNATAGTFMASPAGLQLNASTGAITLAGSAPGTYTITNTVGAGGGCAAVSATAQVILDATPAASITASGPTTFCQGGSVVLTASGGGSYLWSTGATTASITVSASGTYGVTATNAAGCSSAAAAVAVTVTPQVTAAFSYPAGSFCTTAASITPTITGTSGGNFSAGAGLVLDAQSGVINAGASTPGTYTVTYAVGTACPASATAQVTISAPATAGFGYGNDSFCTTQSGDVPATLTAGASAGVFTSTSGLTLNASTGAITPSVSIPGAYTVTNTIAASGGCAAVTATSTVVISEVPTATLTAGGPVAFCQGGSVVLIAPAGAGLTYQFFSNGTAISGATAASYTATTAGTYSVVVTNAAGCSATSAATAVTVNPATTATFAYSGSTYCLSGTNPTPTVTGTTGGSFTAATGLQLNTSTGAITLAGSTPGTYVVTYSVGSTCSASSTQTITVAAAPATPTLSVVYNGSTTTLTSSVAVSNQFYFNGVAIPGATAQSYVVNSVAQYGAYTVVVTNAAGCVSAPSPALIVNSSVKPLAGASLSIYPNPTSDGQLTVALTGYRKAAQLAVINALGQVVYSGTVPAGQATTSLQLTDMPIGVYVLRVQSEGSVDTRRIVRR